MKKRTLTNSFHNTSVTILVEDKFEDSDEREIYMCLQNLAYNYRDQSAQRKLRRIEKALCGMSDCCCGTVR